MTETVDYVILISDYATELIRKIDENEQKKHQVKSEKFVKFIDKLQKKTLEEITYELNLSNDREPLIIPAIILLKRWYRVSVQRQSGYREQTYRMVLLMITDSAISCFPLHMILMRMFFRQHISCHSITTAIHHILRHCQNFLQRF